MFIYKIHLQFMILKLRVEFITFSCCLCNRICQRIQSNIATGECAYSAVYSFVYSAAYSFVKLDLTRLLSQTTSSRSQVDKEAIGLSRVQQFSHLCVARPYQISVNSIFKHIHTTSINTIIWQFVPFIYHPL